MQKKVEKKRCVCYCRKSTDEGLDMEYNSLDAQREACENYIASQKANGWTCLPTRYDDGGYSGGNTNRPALQKLLSDCEKGLVDIIVVYKIDRLSRSICDFADLSKKFDEWGVQFVSVTQEINTASSAGRMMLNILITFAQFEREVITERIRDKMAASRKKGIWIGGSVPLGYRVENKHLVICNEEAEIVRTIFQRFIETQSPKLIAHEMNQVGSRTRKGKDWNTSHIYRILNNHTYVGEVKYKDEVYKGEHAGIISREVWDRTQEILGNNAPVSSYSRRLEILAPLKGILRCGNCGGAMMPTYARKGERRYHYYLCCKDSKRAQPDCPVHQVPSAEIEELVKKEIKHLLCEPGMAARISEKCDIPTCDILAFFQERFWTEISPGEYNRLIQLLVEKVVIWTDKVEIEMKTGGLRSLMEALNHDECTVS